MKSALFNVILFVFFLSAPICGYAQNLPMVLGSVLEISTEIIRITPFAGLWINGLGFARIGVSTGSEEQTDSEGSVSETKRLDFSTQIGFSAIGPERPYLSASYTRSKIYSPNSDAAWNELGLGIGHRFSLSPFAAIVIEAEHRWIPKHYDSQQDLDISSRRLQMNFGLVVYPY
ncbi:MAG: porin family protein [Fibromonadales bacterium]|nr:porin family protein [Fibromonadales bacterium]